MATELDDRRTNREGAAVSLRGGPVKKPLGWLPWVALLLAGLLALGALLVARNVGDEGDDPGVDLSDDPASPDASGDGGSGSGSDAAGTSETGTGAGNDADTGGGATTPSSAAQAPAGAGDLSATGTDLLPTPANGYAAMVGQPATGRGVRVESVVADEAFWVGTGPQERVLVVLTPEARGTNGESPFQVQAGQSIDLDAQVVAVEGDPADLGVTDTEGAEQLRTQGAYLLATRVALA